jgi:hypothetical protein
MDGRGSRDFRIAHAEVIVADQYGRPAAGVWGSRWARDFQT